MKNPLIQFRNQLLAGLLLAGSFCVRAEISRAAESKVDAIDANLISSVSTITPGKPFTLGVFFKIKPGWHIYWQFSGDAGLPPEIEWKLPDGWSAGKIMWPVPTRFTEKGPITTYGYKDSVLLMTEITPSATNGGMSNAAISANVDWLVCHEECVPGKATLSLNIPIAGSGSDPRAQVPASRQRFRFWRQRLPLTLSSSGIVGKLSAERADDSGKIAQVTLKISSSNGVPLKILDWFPSPTEDFALKKIARTDEKDATLFSFRFQSFKGVIPAGAELESLVVYQDEKGKRRAAAIVSQVKVSR